MKVKVLRSVLVRVADLQRGAGDVAVAQALDRLATLLQKRDKEDVTKVVAAIAARRNALQGP